MTAEFRFFSKLYSEMKLLKVISFLFCGLLANAILIGGCDDSPLATRDDYQRFRGIEYGVNFWSSDALHISIRNLNRLSDSEVLNFSYCLAHEKQLEESKKVSLVFIESHYYHIEMRPKLFGQLRTHYIINFGADYDDQGNERLIIERFKKLKRGKQGRKQGRMQGIEFEEPFYGC